jgi:hypothetical protein
MRAELLTRFDAARETLEAFAAFAPLDRCAAGELLLSDAQAMRVYGVETLVPRWIRRPLEALRDFEEARREIGLALEAMRDRLDAVQKRLDGARLLGEAAAAAELEQEAARLLCFEHELRERHASPDGDLVAAARVGITRVLEVSLPILARSTQRYADLALDGAAGEPRLAMKHVEAYQGFVDRANAVTGGLDVPVLRTEYLTRLRELVKPPRRTRRRTRGASASPG